MLQFVAVKRLNTKKLMDKLGISSRETVRKLQMNPAFPQPIYDDGSPVKFWLDHEVDAYIQRLADARDQTTRKRKRRRQPSPTSS